MGKKGLRIRVTDARNVACGSSTLVALIVISLALVPALAGCSSFSSPASSSAQTSAAPPPQYSAAPAPAAATDDAAASAFPYPKQSLVELFKDTPDSPPTPSGPRPPSTYTPAGQPYAANPPAYSASASTADRSNMPHPPSTYTPSGEPYPANPPYGTAPAAPPPQPPQAAVPGYPQQSLFDLFSSK